MKYNFKVNIDKVYKYFLEDEAQIDYDYIEKLKTLFVEFRVKYCDDYYNDDKLTLISQLEGSSDKNQILLVGISQNKEETTLCYYFIGAKEDILNEQDELEYKEGIRVLNEILKCEI
ncbi:hypothetical protein [Clostridium butyricum]|uniref:hypothetical protein n=1 Tax=Clostridium butyricum TaxID=1492 RepID=UPI00325B00A4